MKCRVHTENQAAASCIDCGEYYCAQCLNSQGRCVYCEQAAERFIDGFGMALARWETDLRQRAVETPQAGPPRESRKFSYPRLIIGLFFLLAGVSAYYFFSNYHLIIGEMFSQRGYYAKARFHLEKAAQKEPENPELLFALGNIYYQMEDLESSIAAYRRSIELDSLYAPALNNLAWTYAQMNIRLDEALSLSKRSLALEPNSPSFLDTLAEIYFLKKEYYRALTYIRKAVDQNPPNIEYYRHRLEKIKRQAYNQSRYLEV